jgi:hypothetical protein
MSGRFAKRSKSAFGRDQECLPAHNVYEFGYVHSPRFAVLFLTIVECQRPCLSCWPFRIEAQHDLFLAFRMLLSP